MKLPQSLKTRLILSHLLVSVVSIILMATFAGRSIIQNANAEAEHNLQGLAFAAANALVLPIQELRGGNVEAIFIKETLIRMFANNPDMRFTVFQLDGTPLVDSSENLPPKATRKNAPEVWESLEPGIGRGVSIRRNGQGAQVLYLAVLVQREIEVTAILRLSTPLEPTQANARNQIYILALTALLVAIAVSLFGWLLATNLARPIQVLRRAAEDMELGNLGVRVTPRGPLELTRLAEAFNKMASRLQTNVNELRAFVANASHELRTPLTVVKLRTESLQDGALEDPPVAKRFLAEIECEVDRLVRMVNDLLDLSRMEAGMVPEQPTLLNLSTIATDVYETFKMRSERSDINLELDIEPGLPSVMGNDDQLRRVFYNLLDNAIKYTPSGGEVDLRLLYAPNGNAIRVLVEDNGPGIAPEHVSHVFERFYRVETPYARDNSIRGSGLGLAIVKTIVESHGGEVGVSSKIDGGTKFWADFPAHE
jgi:signal transduction histidine kinase